MRVHAFSGNSSLYRRAGYDNWRPVPIGKLLYALRAIYGDEWGADQLDEFILKNQLSGDIDFSTGETISGDVWFPGDMLLYLSRAETQEAFADWENGDLDPQVTMPYKIVAPSYIPPAPQPAPIAEESFDEEEFYMQEYYQQPTPSQPQQTSYPSTAPTPAPAPQPVLTPASYTPSTVPPQNNKGMDWMPVLLVGGGIAAAMLLFGKKPRGKKR